MDSLTSQPLYAQGRKFVEAKQWEEAIEVFALLVQEQ
jgi:hypothetical protein